MGIKETLNATSRWALRRAGFADKRNLARNINNISGGVSGANLAAFRHDLFTKKIINRDTISPLNVTDVNLVWRRSSIQDDFTKLMTPDLYNKYSMKYSALAIAKGLPWTAGKLFDGTLKLFSVAPCKVDVWKWVGYGLTGIGLSQLGPWFLGLGIANMVVREIKTQPFFAKAEPRSWRGVTHKFVTNRLSWVVTAADVVALTNVIHSADLFIPSVLWKAGALGTAGSGTLLINYLGRQFQRGNYTLEGSLGGQMTVGEKVRMLMGSALKTMFFEKAYLQTRLLFFLPAMINMAECMAAVHPAFSAVISAFLFVSGAGAIASRFAGVKNDPAKRHDWTLRFRAYQHWAVLLAGGCAAGITSIVASDPVFIQAYSMIVGSALMMGADFFTTWFSSSTNKGYKDALHASSRPPLGEFETKKLADGKLNMFNRADTGLIESAWGVYFTALQGQASSTLYQYDRNIQSKVIGSFRITWHTPSEEENVIAFYRRMIDSIGTAGYNNNKRRLVKYIHQLISVEHCTVEFDRNEGKKKIEDLVDILPDNRICDLSKKERREYVGRLRKLVNNMFTAVQDFKRRELLIELAAQKKKKMFDAILLGEDPHADDIRKAQNINDQYARLAKNLRYASGVLTGMINQVDADMDHYNKTYKVFDASESEFIEMNKRMLEQRTAILMRCADELDADRIEDRMSPELLNRKLFQDIELEGYDDSRKAQVIPTDRKAINGDDGRVQKELNLAAFLISRGFPLYELAYDEAPGQVYPTLDYITGNYVGMLNPNFSYLETSGINAAPVVWVPLNKVLEMMNRHDGGPTEHLTDRDMVGSTSSIAKEIDCTPSRKEGFINAPADILFEIEGQTLSIPAKEAFFLNDPLVNRHKGVPWIKKVILRDNSTMSRDEFIGHMNGILLSKGGKAMGSDGGRASGAGATRMLNLPMYDVATLTDKPDVSFPRMTMAMLVKYQNNVPDAYAKITYRDKNGKGRNIPEDRVVDAPIMLSTQNGRYYLPYVKDPGVLRENHLGYMGREERKNMRLIGAAGEISNGHLIDFKFVYTNKDGVNTEVNLFPSEWPKDLEKYLGLKDGRFGPCEPCNVTASDFQETNGDLSMTGDPWVIFDSKDEGGN